jgi:hypothetical protein
MTGYNMVDQGGPGQNNFCGNCAEMNNNNIVYDNDDFDLSACPTGSCLLYEGRLSFTSGTVSSNAGVTVKNSKFHGNCADGIMINGDAGQGITVGPGNEFYNLLQGSCGPHVDSIQQDGKGGTITGNYFHDNETGIAEYDGGGGQHVYSNNVFRNISRTDETILLTGESGSTVEHNTVYGSNAITFGLDHSGTPATNMTFRNNVSMGGLLIQGSGDTFTFNDYNLCGTGAGGTCPGAHSINGQTPQFVSASPASHDDYLLKFTSPGHLAASDGTDMGIYALGGITPPPPPPPSSDTTPPTTSITSPTTGSTVSNTVSVTANASDNVGVDHVEFYVDGSLATTDTSSPYSYSWNTQLVTNGSHTLVSKAYDAAGNVGTSSTITVTTSNTTTCKQSSTTWQNTSFSAQTSSFTFDFDATPSASGIDTVTGLSNGAATDYPSLAVIVRFNSTGTIDAINDTGKTTGGNYTAVNSIPYTAATSYHFKLTVNPSNHTYSAIVTPSGGSATTLATNYGFRFEQASTSSLNNWALYSLSGSESVCSATVAAGGTTKIGDLNNDGSVNIFDLSILLSKYNTSTASADLNNDGIVNVFDLSILLSHYGT